LRVAIGLQSRSSFDPVTEQWILAPNALDYGFEKYPNDWLRVWVCYEVTSSGNHLFRVQLRDTNNNAIYTGDGASSLFVWGRQIELGHGPSPIIATAGSSVTRTSALVSVPAADLPDFATNKQLTLFFDSYLDHADDGQVTSPTLEIADGSTTDSLRLFTEASNRDALSADMYVGGVRTTLTGTQDGLDFGERVKIAVRFSDHTGTARVCINGTLQTETAISAVPDLTDAILRFGALGDAGVGVNAVACFARALSDADMQELTS
ncbi:MAG: hypothetical protein AAFR27_10385, partial [Pseudomonadota bacterium]